MVAINQNARPHVPPVHLRPGEAPRIIHHSNPGLMNPTQLAAQLGQLNVGGRPSNGQHAKAPVAPHVHAHDVSAPTPLYEGYTFFKADAGAGQKSTWGRIERTKMSQGQNELSKMVQTRSKKLPAAEQYEALTKAKRTLVDQLIEQRARFDAHLGWECVYAKTEEKPKGKNARRGELETVSMDVVIMGLAKAATNPNAPQKSVKIETPEETKEKNLEKPVHPTAEKETRPINKISDLKNKVQWVKPGNTRQQPPTMKIHIPQRDDSPPPYPRPQAPPDPNPFPHPRPAEGHSSGRGQPMERPWSQAPAVQQPYNVPQAQPNLGSGRGMPSAGAQAVPPSHNGFYPRRMEVRGRPPFVRPAAGPAPETQHSRARSGSEPHPVNGHPGSVQPPHDLPGKSKSPVDSEDDRTTGTPNLTERVKWPAGSSETEDESILSGGDDEDDWSSVTEDLSDESDLDSEEDEELENKTPQKPQPWRGSLWRRHSSQKLNRRHPVYRIHCRKWPNSSSPNKDGDDSNPNRGRSPAGNTDCSMEEVVSTTRHTSDNNAEWRAATGQPPREITVPGTRGRPTIIHEAEANPGPLDSSSGAQSPLDEEQVRMHNDIRTKILNDREARLERREKLVDFHAKMLAEKLEEARFMNQRMALREPFYYRPYSPPRRYPLPEY